MSKDGLKPIGAIVKDAVSGLDGPVPSIHETPPPARRGFTQADQVDQLVWASEQDPEMGFMARMIALCSASRAPTPATSTSTSGSQRPLQTHHGCRWRQQAPLRQPPAPAAGLGLNRSGTYPKPRAGPGFVRSPSSCATLGMLKQRQRRHYVAFAPGSATRWTGSFSATCLN